VAPDGPAPVIREAGDSGLLLVFAPRIEPAVNDRAVAAAAAVRHAGLAGVRDVVPTIRSVAVYFDPLAVDRDAVVAALEAAARVPPAHRSSGTVEVPVVYGGIGGPDLGRVAAWAGLPEAEVVRRHAAPAYRVYMMGFLPGFAYLGAVDSTIAAPRRHTPRLRVPAGAVGIAGHQTGVYPVSAPGGWQLVGRSALRLFDPDRMPAARLSPGDTVRFVPVEGQGEPVPWQGAPRGAGAPGRSVSVLAPGMLTTVQDNGRWGHQAHGVTPAGALDMGACARANAAVGNPPGAAALEVTLLGPELRLEASARVAVTGADLSPVLDGRALPRDRAVAGCSGAVLRFGRRVMGTRAYVAFDGGIDTPPVLGSRATHVRSRLGGAAGGPVRAGDCLPLGAAATTAPARVAVPALPQGGARLRVVAGPHDEAFGPAARDALVRTRFVVSTASDRMGCRLDGPALPDTPPDGAMISDATFPGAIQVPPSGHPILLLADRPTTGGYPQIGVVAAADLDTAAQLGPGDWVEFTWCSRTEAVASLAEQRSAGG
jgi:KipI family sensor histidine kinase inhibitor